MKKYYVVILISSFITLHASEESQKEAKIISDHEIKSESVLHKVTDETNSVDAAAMTILEAKLCAFERIANDNKDDLARQVAGHMFNAHATVYLQKVAHELERENVSILALRKYLHTLYRIDNHITEQDKIKTVSELCSKCHTLYVKKSSEITNVSSKE